MKRFFAFLCLVASAALAAADGQPLATAAAPGDLTIEFLDIGQGDSVLIRTPDGKVALVDTGTPKKGAYPYLEARDIKTVDLLVTSHHHSDHMGGTVEVLEECSVKAYLDSGSSYTSKSYKNVLQAVKASTKTKTLYPRPNTERKINLGESVVIRVFPQPPEDEDNENNNSVGLRIQYKDFALVLTGDSEDDERAWWMKNANKTLYSKATILKLAHHGSHNGSDAEWLKAVAPELAVVSCAAGNSYGHPHKKTLDLLADKKIELKRTDMGGTIKIKTNGQTWEVSQVASAPGLFRGEPVARAGGWYTTPARPARAPEPRARFDLRP